MVKKQTTSVKKVTVKKVPGVPRRIATTGDDFRNALLLVSLTINVIILIGWIALKVTSKFDEQVARFLFG